MGTGYPETALGPGENLTVGVLALQGDVAEHVLVLTRLGVGVRRVKTPAGLNGLDGLIIPGGESTTMGKLLRWYDMLDPLRAEVAGGLPVYGTCAGMILLARDVVGQGVDQPTLGGMDIVVERNAFGPQTESFESDLRFRGVAGPLVHAVFIRAPVILEVGPNVEVLARLEDNTPVAARQHHILVTSFHPELSGDDRIHQLFVRMVGEARVTRKDGTYLSRSVSA